MVGVGLTAIVLFFLSASLFSLIAFFSLYLVLVGWRFAINRKGEVSGGIWPGQFGMGGGVALLAMAVIATAGAPVQSLETLSVPTTFGIISISFWPSSNILLRGGQESSRRSASTST